MDAVRRACRLAVLFGCISLLFGAAPAAKAGPIGDEPEHVSVENDTSMFTLDIYYQAFGCFDIVGGIGLVCHADVIGPGQVSSYKFDDLTTFRQIRVALNAGSLLTAEDLLILLQKGIIASYQIAEFPEGAPLQILKILPDLLKYLVDLKNYTDLFITREDEFAHRFYSQDQGEALLQRTSQADTTARALPEPSSLLLVAGGASTMIALRRRRQRGATAN